LLRGDSLEGAILATVAYYDVFAFAPQPREIHRFLVGKRASRREVERALGDGRLSRELGTRDGCWFLIGKDHLAPRRLRFSKHSAALWPRARSIARLVERSGLALSGMVTGSLAAENADEHADIDFLFIYPHERTWTSYASMRVMAKLPFPGMSDLCPNYVLAADQLEIRPQNLFTAWEIAKAVPMFGFNVFERFLRANQWVSRYLPNALPSLEAEIKGYAPSPSPTDPGWLRALTRSPLFQKLERLEKKRKFGRDRRDVGVDMDERQRKGSMDRHSPTRSFHTLSELRYRMDQLGIQDHPLYAEVDAATSMLRDEMTLWGTERLERRSRAVS
jgi:hypothetical protein